MDVINNREALAPELKKRVEERLTRRRSDWADGIPFGERGAKGLKETLTTTLDSFLSNQANYDLLVPALRSIRQGQPMARAGVRRLGLDGHPPGQSFAFAEESRPAGEQDVDTQSFRGERDAARGAAV